MQLTGKEIIDFGVIQNYCEKGIQQQGIDVRVEDIYMLDRLTPGVVSSGDKKTVLPNRVKLNPTDGDKYYLAPGYYELDLMEGCKIPNNMTLQFKTRSSLVRCGALIHSGQFDAGFETTQMGCFLQVLIPVTIEKHARVAQALVYQTNEVNKESLYNGQWQNDKQREKS